MRMRGLGTVLRMAICVALGAWGGLPHRVQADAAESTSPAALSPAATEAVEHLGPLWESMKSDVVSCEVRFRKYFRVKPVAPLTRDQLGEVFQRHDLGEHPERVPDFLREVAGSKANVEVPERHLYIQGQHRKHQMGLLTHVHDDNFSFIHDGDNKQVHVYERGRCPSGTPGLELFRPPMQPQEGDARPDRVDREGNLVRLTTMTPPQGPLGEIRTTSTIDWSTGVVLQRLRELDGEVVQEVNYTRLTTHAGGITFPHCVLTARYAKGFLQTMDLALLDDARFNETIPESTFVASKPEGWDVLDFREQANGTGIPAPRSPVDDVRTLIPSFALNPLGQVPTPESEKRPMSLPKRVLLVLNGLALMALGVWMWKRASLKEPTH